MKHSSKKWNGQPAVYAHLKLDGHFTRVEKRDGKLRFTTSRPTDITHQIPEKLKANLLRFVPDGADLLGELWVPNEPASFVKSALKDCPERLNLTYFADMNRGEDTRLETLSDDFARWGLSFALFTRLSDGWSPEVLMQEAITFGAEGWMLKDGNLLNWMKLKAVQTADCVVFGVKEGKGKHLGLIGSLEVGLYDNGCLVEVADVGGFDDETREMFSDDPPIGQVVEVAYQYIGSGGRMRHPCFIRVRDDKVSSECTMEQLK